MENNPKFMPTEAIAGELVHNDRERELCAELLSRIEYHRERQNHAAATVYGIIDPDYARIFTVARLLAWQEGYAVAMHGSFTRDLDLVAAPWTDKACEPEHLVRRILAACENLREQHGNPGAKPHGRKVWTLIFSAFGDPRFVDLSILPRANT